VMQSAMSYENWIQLESRLVLVIVKAFSETMNAGDSDPEWFRIYVKPLPKKPGKLEARPISLLNNISSPSSKDDPVDQREWLNSRSPIRIHGRDIFRRPTV
jgi:hypothetical protein